MIEVKGNYDFILNDLSADKFLILNTTDLSKEYTSLRIDVGYYRIELNIWQNKHIYDVYQRIRLGHQVLTYKDKPDNMDQIVEYIVREFRNNNDVHNTPNPHFEDFFEDYYESIPLDDSSCWIVNNNHSSWGFEESTKGTIKEILFYTNAIECTYHIDCLTGKKSLYYQMRFFGDNLEKEVDIICKVARQFKFRRNIYPYGNLPNVNMDLVKEIKYNYDIKLGYDSAYLLSENNSISISLKSGYSEKNKEFMYAVAYVLDEMYMNKQTLILNPNIKNRQELEFRKNILGLRDEYTNVLEAEKWNLFLRDLFPSSN